MDKLMSPTVWLEAANQVRSKNMKKHHKRSNLRSFSRSSSRSPSPSAPSSASAATTLLTRTACSTLTPSPSPTPSPPSTPEWSSSPSSASRHTTYSRSAWSSELNKSQECQKNLLYVFPPSCSDLHLVTQLDPNHTHPHYNASLMDEDEYHRILVRTVFNTN